MSWKHRLVLLDIGTLQPSGGVLLEVGHFYPALRPRGLEGLQGCQCDANMSLGFRWLNRKQWGFFRVFQALLEHKFYFRFMSHVLFFWFSRRVIFKTWIGSDYAFVLCILMSNADEFQIIFNALFGVSLRICQQDTCMIWHMWHIEWYITIWEYIVYNYAYIYIDINAHHRMWKGLKNSSVGLLILNLTPSSDLCVYIKSQESDSQRIRRWILQLLPASMWWSVG